MATQVIKISEIGDNLGTRKMGLELFNTLSALLGSGNKIVVDFSDVDALSHSFADESFAKLMEETTSLLKDGRLKFINANDFVKTILRKVIQDRMVNSRREFA